MRYFLLVVYFNENSFGCLFYCIDFLYSDHSSMPGLPILHSRFDIHASKRISSRVGVVHIQSKQ